MIHAKVRHACKAKTLCGMPASPAKAPTPIHSAGHASHRGTSSGERCGRQWSHCSLAARGPPSRCMPPPHPRRGPCLGQQLQDLNARQVSARVPRGLQGLGVDPQQSRLGGGGVTNGGMKWSRRTVGAGGVPWIPTDVGTGLQAATWGAVCPIPECG